MVACFMGSCAERTMGNFENCSPKVSPSCDYFHRLLKLQDDDASSWSKVHKVCRQLNHFVGNNFYSKIGRLVGEFRDLSRADTELTFWPKKNEKFGQRPLASD